MSTRDDIIREARARLSIPYALPPDGVHTLDCSLYVLKVYEAAGLPFSGVRTAEQIRAACVPITFAEVLPGDLLFFERTYDITERSRVGDGHVASHIGISLGAGTKRILNAVEPASKETDISTPYWQSHLFEARRAPQLTTSPGGPVTDQPRGVDVASYQGQPDWAAVAASGIAFGITKLTEGTGYVNPTAAYNWRGMAEQGLARGAYHFARPSANSAEAEADYFASRLLALGTQPGDLAALDLEDTGAGDVGGWALDWLRLVEQRIGWRPIVYTGQWYIDGHNLRAYPALGDYPLWIAAYQGQMPAPPAPWNLISFWQYSDSGSVPGISGAVDLDLFNGRLERLPLLGKPANSEPMPPQPDPGPGLPTRAEIDAIVASLTDIRDRLPA